MTDLILSQPQECIRLEALRGEIAQIYEVAIAQKVLDTATKDAALAVGAQVKRVRKALEDRRKDITSPLEDLKKQIIAFAKTLDAPLEQAEAHIRKEATAYATRIAEQQIREQEAVAAEKRRIEQEKENALRTAAAFARSTEEQLLDAGNIEEDAKQKRTEAAIREKEIKAQGVKGTKTVWKYEVINTLLVPRKYLAVDEPSLRQAVKLGERDIPGVRIYSDIEVALRSY